MSRTPKAKELVNTRLASGYGGWIYCDCCGKNIGYLCYITYNSFSLSYRCNCGSCGSMYIAFEEDSNSIVSDNDLITIKNRLCCATDQSPLFTILEKNIENYNYEVVCKDCNAKFKGGKTI